MAKKRLFRFIKWFFGIIIALVLSITAALFIFKDDICDVVIKEVNKHLNAKVSVGEVDLAFWGSFPSLSIDFNQVFIQDSFEGSTELDTLLFSDKIRLKLNPLDIWRETYTIKSLEIHPGVLKLKVNNKGLNNYDIFKPTADTTNSEFDFNLKEVEFDGFRFSYINHVTDQEYRTLINNMHVEGNLSSSVFTTKAKSDIEILKARSGNVTLVKNKPASFNFAVNVNMDSNIVEFPQSTIYISNLPFDFQGIVENDRYDFNLKAKNIQIKDVANNLAMRGTDDVKKFSGQGILLFNLDIEGEKGATKPASVECSFGIKNATLRDPSTGINISKLKMDGIYSNKGGSKKEKLHLKNISFQTKGGPFVGEVLLNNFSNPTFSGNADGTLNLAIVHSLFRIPKINELSGTIDIRSSFLVKGKENDIGLVEYGIEKCNGSIKMNDVNLQIIDDKRMFSSINGLVYLKNSEAGIEDVTLSIGKSDFRINGAFKDVVNYFTGQGKLLANVDIKSNQIHLEDLGTDTKEDKLQRERQYALPNNIDGTVYLDVARLQYGNHTYNQLKGNMSIIGRRINFPTISVENGGANVLGSLTIEEQTPEIFNLSCQMISNNINFKSLFKEWNDFNQDVIKSDNIEGVAQANVQFEAPFDLRTGVISKAIIAQVGIQIDDGRLKNVETFNKIIASLKTSSVKLILGKENINALSSKLKDLKFAQLKNTLIIRDGVLTIPSMSISSSALDIEVSGQHTFDNKIDYRFGFGYRDLIQKKESEFGEIVDDGTGIQLFMRMFGDLANPTIQWDKQSRKEKTKEYNEKEKQDIKAILKSEFGLFKNDSTVKTYIKSTVPKEELIIEFDPENSIDTIIDVQKPKKDTKLNRWLKKMKEDSEAEKKEEFEIDN